MNSSTNPIFNHQRARARVQVSMNGEDDYDEQEQLRNKAYIQPSARAFRCP